MAEKDEKKKTRKTAIYFETSLKWNKDGKTINIKEVLQQTKHYYEIYAITHKKGTEEEHTHFWIKCKTPRTLENIANIFNVEKNFISYIKSPRAQLRYITHIDYPEKEQYSFNEVQTNSPISYEEKITSFDITRRELFTEFINTNNLEKTLLQYIESLNGAELYSIYKLAKEVKRFNYENNIIKENEKQKEIEIANFITEIQKDNIKLIEENKKLKEKIIENLKK